MRKDFLESVSVELGQFTVYFTDEAIAIQVTKTCAHSQICNNTEQRVRSIMSKSSVSHSYEVVANELYLIIPLKKSDDPTTVLMQLTELLDLYA